MCFGLSQLPFFQGIYAYFFIFLLVEVVVILLLFLVLFSSGAGGWSRSRPRKSRNVILPLHQSFRLRFFCFSCRFPIWRRCLDLEPHWKVPKRLEKMYFASKRVICFGFLFFLRVVSHFSLFFCICFAFFFIFAISQIGSHVFCISQIKVTKNAKKRKTTLMTTQIQNYENNAKKSNKCKQ